MSKTNDTSKLNHATLDDHGTLADSELGAPDFKDLASGTRSEFSRGSSAEAGCGKKSDALSHS